jgi:cytochrome c
MDSHEWNKIIGGILGTVLFVLAVHAIAQAIYAAPEPEKPAFAVASAQPSAPASPAPAQAAAPGQTASATPAAPAAAPPPAAPAEEVPDFATAIPAADAMAGEMVAERCMVCHDTAKDGTNKIGPLLYGVVGRGRASFPGFDYSAAMKAKGGTWTYAELYQFLRAPLTYIPGTKMTFAGLPRTQDRLNLIAYLRMQADTPAPLP